MTLNHEEIQCQIKRINDETHSALSKHSLCITECLQSWWDYVYNSDNEQQKATPLAFFLAAFESAYGPSGNMFDSYKGAFSFAFAIRILRDDWVIPYLLQVTCWRGSVEFHFRKPLAADEARYDINTIHKPFDNELSEQQMRIVANFLMGFAEGFWMSAQCNRDKWAMLDPAETQADFVKAIDSNAILFGRKEGRLFEMHYADSAEYARMKRELLIPYQQAQYLKMVEVVFGDSRASQPC
jgi:hypothetical protein